MNPQLTPNEAMLVVDALNGTIFHNDQPELNTQLLPLEIKDAIAIDHLDEKWHVDGPALVEKLSHLTAKETATVIQKSETFWSNPNYTRSETIVTEIGLATLP